MSETAEKTAEIVAENVEEAVDGTVEVMEIIRNNPKVLVGVAIAAAVAGGVGGYFIAKRKLRTFYEDLSSQEIAEAKEFYANLNKVDVEGNPLSPQQMLDSLHGVGTAAKALHEYQGNDADTDDEDEEDEALLRKTESKVTTKASFSTLQNEEDFDVPSEHVEESTTEVQNVFIDPTFDLKEEVKYRTADRPYIITLDEFYAADLDHDTESLIYYATDDVLCDEQDKPIDNKEEVIGEDHLVRFGSGSGNRNRLFVRNERLSMDYEITKSEGSYLEEVLAMTPDNAPGPEGG